MKYLKKINEFFGYYFYQKEEFTSFDEFKSYVESNRSKFKNCMWDILPTLPNAEKYFNNYLKDGSFVIVFQDGGNEDGSVEKLTGGFKDSNGEFRDCHEANDKPCDVETFRQLYGIAEENEKNRGGDTLPTDDVV